MYKAVCSLYAFSICVPMQKAHKLCSCAAATEVFDEVSSDWEMDQDQGCVGWEIAPAATGAGASTSRGRGRAGGLKNGTDLFSSHREMLAEAATILVEHGAEAAFKLAQEDPWLFATTILTMVLYKRLKSALGVKGVEGCRGVSQLWEYVVACLFSIWLSIPASNLYASRKVVDTDHLTYLRQIKLCIPVDMRRRWGDLLTFIPSIFHERCTVKTTRLETLPSLRTLVTLRNQFASWVATHAESGFEFSESQRDLWGVRRSRVAPRGRRKRRGCG